MELTPKEAIIGAIGLVLMIFLIEYGSYKLDKANCEANGGTYIWSFNQYETKCHFKGEE